MKIATESYENIYQEFTYALDWLQSLDVFLGAGRTQHYEKVVDKWSKSYSTASEQQAKNIFPEFVSSMFEIMDFIDIYNSLKNVSKNELKFVASKLQKGVNGPINSILETANSTSARNYLFEVLVAARFHRPEKGVKTIFDSQSDTGLKICNKKIWIECKRITSLDKLEANVSKACKQLELILIQDPSTQSRGIVAIDFTKIFNPGDKIFVKKNDEDLQKGISLITEQMISENSSKWENVYFRKNNKIIGTLLRFSTMASSEERNLIVRACEWGLNPRTNISSADENLLNKLASSMS